MNTTKIQEKTEKRDDFIIFLKSDALTTKSIEKEANRILF